MNSIATVFRGLILATQFLTRLPTPQVKDFKPEDLAKSALWFPVVGVLLGLMFWALAHLTGFLGSSVTAFLIVLTWGWVTGGLHLDGLMDLSDALGASHRSPERFFEVLKDPHTGSFAVVSAVFLILGKFVFISEILQTPKLWPVLIVIPAMARWGSLFWSQTLKSLQPGMGERFRWQLSQVCLYGAFAVLAVFAAVVSPWALVSVVGILAYRQWLQVKLGGMTGDCLGAGIEIVEASSLLLSLLIFRLWQFL